MLGCEGLALIGFNGIVCISCSVNLSTESELYFMLPIFYVSNISLKLTFYVVNTDVSVKSKY